VFGASPRETAVISYRKNGFRNHLLRGCHSQTQSIDLGAPTGRESLKFFLELHDATSPLLNFQYKGRDKWQIVHAWLRSDRRIADDGEAE
jgi:hypothetical protein